MDFWTLILSINFIFLESDFFYFKSADFKFRPVSILCLASMFSPLGGQGLSTGSS